MDQFDSIHITHRTERKGGRRGVGTENIIDNRTVELWGKDLFLPIYYLSLDMVDNVAPSQYYVSRSYTCIMWMGGCIGWIYCCEWSADYKAAKSGTKVKNLVQYCSVDVVVVALLLLKN